jgi:hypothetical protein
MDGSVVMAVDKAPTSADQKGRDQVYQLAWQGGGTGPSLGMFSTA